MLVRESRGLEVMTDRFPSGAINRKMEPEVLLVEIDAKENLRNAIDGNLPIQRLFVLSVIRGKNRQGFSKNLVVADAEINPVVGVVDTHQTGHLLEGLWLKFEAGFRPRIERLESPRDEALLMSRI